MALVCNLYKCLNDLAICTEVRCRSTTSLQSPSPDFFGWTFVTEFTTGCDRRRMPSSSTFTAKTTRYVVRRLLQGGC